MRTITYPEITDTRPIWEQKPVPWHLADGWAEHIVDTLLVDVPALGTDRDDLINAGASPDGVQLAYGFESQPAVHPMTVCLHADLDGILVNAFDAGTGFGPDLLPLSKSGLGLHVRYGVHPRHGDAWWGGFYPRLKAAVEVAAEAVAAVRDGRSCGSAAGIGEFEYPCRRPAGHAEARPDLWGEHANRAVTWTADGITSSHPKAVVLR